MPTIPAALQTKLDLGVTTLARCWIITRDDGVVQGFTEHDEDVVVGGVICLAGSGLAGSEATAKLGLAVDGSEMSGALSDDTLNEDDLAAGRYDAAGVELWLVDWSEPDLLVLLAKGTLGEVKREGTAFVAEMRGLSQKLAEDSGRLFTSNCSADLGDARCTVDFSNAAYHGSGTVAALSAVSAFTANGLDTFDGGWFTAGKLTFTGGANAGLAIEVKSHGKSAGGVSVTLWQAMAQPIAVGDTFSVTAGCDKRFATCLNRFNNAANFRGFPQIPGNDFVISYPVPGETNNDGAPYVVGI
jgi:uncharacterized phage protein (TIGR02218 family)